MGIDWSEVFLAAAVAGLLGAAALGVHALHRALSRRLGGLRAAAAIALGAGAVGAAVAASPLGRSLWHALEVRRAQAHMNRLIAESMGPVLDSAAFRERAEGLSAEQASALAQDLSAQGLLRLPDERLVRRVALLDVALEGAAEADCAAHLLGPTPEQSRSLLARLPDDALREWSQLSADAVAASLRGDPRRVPNQAQARDALAELLASLPDARRERLSRALTDPAKLPPSEACWAVRTIYGALPGLPAEGQRLVARVLATQ